MGRSVPKSSSQGQGHPHVILSAKVPSMPESLYTASVNITLVRFSLFVLVLLAVLSMSSCWYTKQAFFFLAERARAVPVESLAEDPGLASEVKQFLENIESIRRFAVETLGLVASKNYTRYVALDRGYVADVVSACDSASFKRHYWRYPVVGSLPYKGFYVEADAEREVARLKAAGFDVISRKVDAFSSLGFFIDPLYSFMAAYDIDVMAELVFHESAHATLFIKGADQFNEEFATFLGRKAAELYLETIHGPDSAPIKARAQRSADGDMFTAFLKETARILESVYSDQSLDTAAKLQRKQEIFRARAAVYRDSSASMFTGDAYRDFDMGSINNAFIDMYRLYEEDLGLFEEWYDKVAMRSLPQFTRTLRDLAKSHGKDIKKAMTRQLQVLVR
jgi:predicted aminopeptidase